ncbi:MAG TPA: CPBP family intramembrane glutamic endopeptidase [Acidobacteriaceae bacterium]|jgi:membrane protease YdiL (CAAX protease family)|nr:CPBP family intramembrane glutamic endopeptidase [Acidobacteriaceae bacterium]
MTPRTAIQRALQPRTSEAASEAPPVEMTVIHLLPPRSAAPDVPPLRTSRLFLGCEFVLLFLGLPLVLALRLIRHVPPIPILWAVGAYCLVALLRDPTFDRKQLWNAAPLRRQLLPMLALFCAGAVVVTLLVRLFAPQFFLALPRMHPGFWALVMVLYPVLSVYPQALAYRAFLFHRYRVLLPEAPRAEAWLLIVVSAATFALMHLVFRNWVAIALTFPGGLLFGWRYCRTRSLCVSWLEHALYGCLLFTIGLGPYFYTRFV